MKFPNLSVLIFEKKYKTNVVLLGFSYSFSSLISKYRKQIAVFSNDELSY
jgi:hypothetical protein